MKEFYLEHLKNGVSFEEVDNLDFFYYLDLLIYKANKKDIRFMDDDF